MVISAFSSDILSERSYLDVVVYDFERQSDTLQRYTLDFWDGEWRHTLLLCASVNFVADARLCTSRAAPALFGGGASDPLLGELGKACFGVVVGLFDFTSIDDIDYVVDSDGSL